MGSIEMQKRVVFLDWLRVVACLMVVFIHSTEPFYIGAQGRFQIASRADALWVTFFESLCRICVPLFVMTSSYLLFPVRQSTGEFFRRRFMRVVVPFVVWSFAYVFVYGETVVKFLFNFPDSGGHLWFVPMLLGLYLVMPILSPWAEKVTKRELRGWILLWFVTTLIPFGRWLWSVLFGVPSFGAIPYVWGEAPWNPFGMFHYVSGFVGYLLLGLYARRFPSDHTVGQALCRAVPVWLVGVAGMAFGFYLRIGGTYPTDGTYAATVDSELFLEYCSLFVALGTVGVFQVLRCVTAAGAVYRRVIVPLSQASYRIYLVHLMILLTLAPHVVGHFPTPVAIVVLALATFLLASLVSVFFRKSAVVRLLG